MGIKISVLFWRKKRDQKAVLMQSGDDTAVFIGGRGDFRSDAQFWRMETDQTAFQIGSRGEGVQIYSYS